MAEPLRGVTTRSPGNGRTGGTASGTPMVGALPSPPSIPGSYAASSRARCSSIWSESDESIDCRMTCIGPVKLARVL